MKKLVATWMYATILGLTSACSDASELTRDDLADLDDSSAEVEEDRDAASGDSSGTILPGLAYRGRAERTINGRTTRVSWVFVDLTNPQFIVETSPRSVAGLWAEDYVKKNDKVLAAINANYFTEDNSPWCGGHKYNVVGMASSAGVRWPKITGNKAEKMEIGVGDAGWIPFACSYGNRCDILPYSKQLDDNTRNGTSVYKNMVTGIPHLVKNGQAIPPPASCKDCAERDAISAVALAGKPTDNGYPHLILVQAEGSNIYGTGWDTSDMAQFLVQEFGAKEALRMDSGNSSQLVIWDPQIDDARMLHWAKKPSPCSNVVPVANLLTVRLR